MGDNNNVQLFLTNTEISHCLTLKYTVMSKSSFVQWENVQLILTTNWVLSFRRFLLVFYSSNKIPSFNPPEGIPPQMNLSGL